MKQFPMGFENVIISNQLSDCLLNMKICVCFVSLFSFTNCLNYYYWKKERKKTTKRVYSPLWWEKNVLLSSKIYFIRLNTSKPKFSVGVLFISNDHTISNKIFPLKVFLQPKWPFVMSQVSYLSLLFYLKIYKYFENFIDKFEKNYCFYISDSEP